MWWKRAIAAVSLALTLASYARATEWVADFSSSPPQTWAGSDQTAVASYSDTTGANPTSYTVTFLGIGSVPAGWLTQGSRGGIPTTAKFTNMQDGVSGRARFATPLPATADGNGGIAVGWTARYGNYAMNRAPIQVALYDTGTSTGGTPFNVFFRVQNGTTLAIQSNGGSLYGTIDPLTIPDVGDGNYHTWSCAVITSGGTAYWKLWLDGNLLLFTGTDGSPLFDPGGGAQQFSFRTGSNSFSNIPVPGAAGGYIGLGELLSSDVWDFEFDCVAFKDDGLAVNFTCGGAAPPCDSGVSPASTGTSTALKGGAATPSQLTYTFGNNGSAVTGYTVAQSDQTGAAATYGWFSLSKSGSVSVNPGQTDQVDLTITDTNLNAGTYTGYITFVPTCNPAVKHVRRIDLTIIDCRSSVSPAGDTLRSAQIGSGHAPQPVIYTFENTGAPAVSYSVSSSAAWLQLDKAGGTVAPGGTDAVTGTINLAGLTPGGYTATITFTDTCSPAIQHLRQVLLSVDGTISSPGGAAQQFSAEFTTFTGTDLTSLSPVVSCDPNVATARQFYVQTGGLQVDQLDAGWLTQGSISGVATTALFNNPQGAASGGLAGVGRARFRTFLPFDDTFDPANGMAVAWRMRIGDYSPTRGPMQITFPRVKGPFGTSETLSLPGDVFNAFIRIQNGTNVSILRNGGAQFSGINTLVLSDDISGAYHVWTAAVCYQASDQRAYWNLWIDGQKLLFTGSSDDGSAGSPVGPGGGIYSFRTFLEDVSGDPYIGLGELQSSIDIWDFDFDWVRMLSYTVSGCPFWDGEGCVPAPLCHTPAVDADGDHDVDMDDFAVFQACYTGSGTFTLTTECGCFDRNRDSDVDTLDFQQFQACATGPAVVWTSTPACP